MCIRGRWYLVAVALLCLLSPFAGAAIGNDDDDDDESRSSLVGSWELVASVGGAEELGLVTYGAGGTLVLVNSAPPEFAKTGHGAWVRTGKRTFKSTFRVFVFDGAGNFQFTLKVDSRIQLSKSGNETRSTFRTELLFPDGTVVPGLEGTTRASRIVVE